MSPNEPESRTATDDLYPRVNAGIGPGSIVDQKFRVLESLGEGGMGCVYKARHERLNRLVALKTTYADRLRDPQFAIRFSMEAESIARLKHPNIVQIYDVGRHNEQPYFTMELVEGDSLETVMRRERFSTLDAAEIVRTLAGAIHVAHQMGRTSPCAPRALPSRFGGWPSLRSAAPGALLGEG